MPKLSNTMSRNLVTIPWNRSMESARRLMEEKQIRHLAVTDELGTVYGILSSRDIARALHPTRLTFPEGSVVSNYTSHPIISVRKSASLADAADLMIQKKISSVLVVDDADSAVGIITSEDLHRVLSKNIREGSSKNSLRELWPIVGEFLKEVQSAGI